MRQFLYKTLFAFFLGLTLPQMVFAAQMFFDAKATQAQIGEKFEVKLIVNSEQESINAFEGEISFPGDILNLKEIRDGNTIVNFWIEKPKIQNGAIIFSGITPGGFNGEKGLIFSAIFEARTEGMAKFEINDAKVLRNDGTGSEAVLTTVPFEILVSSEVLAEPPVFPKIKDRERPESFVPEIAKDETLFEGKWFIVFVTQDKTSGIDRYEIKESRQRILSVFKRWTPAESPHVLADQGLRSYIWIKAIDKADNERIARITPQSPLAWYENYGDWVILIVGLLMIAFVSLKVWRKNFAKKY